MERARAHAPEVRPTGWPRATRTTTRGAGTKPAPRSSARLRSIRARRTPGTGSATCARNRGATTATRSPASRKRSRSTRRTPGPGTTSAARSSGSGAATRPSRRTAGRCRPTRAWRRPASTSAGLPATRGDHALAAECFKAGLDAPSRRSHLRAPVRRRCRPQHRARARGLCNEPVRRRRAAVRAPSGAGARVPRARSARETGAARSSQARAPASSTWAAAPAWSAWRWPRRARRSSAWICRRACSRSPRGAAPTRAWSKASLVEVLARIAAGSVQAVLAADVFIYIGDLAAVFAAVARVLAPQGLFAFSVEGLEDGTYRLQPTGRYAQSPAYLRALAAQSGLEERRLERTRIRREGRGHAEGWLALFAKPRRTKLLRLEDDQQDDGDQDQDRKFVEPAEPDMAPGIALARGNRASACRTRRDTRPVPRPARAWHAASRPPPGTSPATAIARTPA